MGEFSVLARYIKRRKYKVNPAASFFPSMSVGSYATSWSSCTSLLGAQLFTLPPLVGALIIP